MARKLIGFLLLILGLSLLPALPASASPSSFQLTSTVRRATGGSALVFDFSLACTEAAPLEYLLVEQRAANGTLQRGQAEYVGGRVSCDGVRHPYKAIILAPADPTAPGPVWSVNPVRVRAGFGSSTEISRTSNVTDPAATIAGQRLDPGITMTLLAPLRGSAGDVAAVRVRVTCPAGRTLSLFAEMTQGQGRRAMHSDSGFGHTWSCDGGAHLRTLELSRASASWQAAPAFVNVSGTATGPGGSSARGQAWAEVRITD